MYSPINSEVYNYMKLKPSGACEILTHYDIHRYLHKELKHELLPQPQLTFLITHSFKKIKLQMKLM